MADRSDDELREGCEAVQADMAAHQRIVGREVTSSANHALAAETFERLERQGLLDEPVIGTEPAVQALPAFSERREVDGRAYRMERIEGDDVRTRRGTPDEVGTFRRALARLQLMVELQDGFPAPGVPGWSIRALACMETLARPLADLARRGIFSEESRSRAFWSEALPLLEQSGRLWGDWAADDPAPKVIVG